MPADTKDAVLALVRDAIKFANFAAGEGIGPVSPEDAADPVDFLMRYSDAVGGIDTESIADDVCIRLAAWNRRAVAPLLDGGEETEGAVEAAAKAIFATRVPALAAAVADPWAEAGQPERRQAFDAARAALAAYAPLIHARIAQAEQAATERAAVDDWQPIETAPHNRVVLLGWADWRDGRWCMEVGAASWGERQPNGYSNRSQHGSATHWHELPAWPAIRARNTEEARSDG